MWKSIVLLCVATALVSGQTTDVSRCISNGGELPINTYIEGCTAPPCLLPQLQDAVIRLVFKTPRLIRRMKTVATAWVWIASTDYDLEENAETCNFLENTYCPVLPGETIMYTLRMYIQRIFVVGTAATIEFRILDDNGDPFICIRVPIRIVRPVTGLTAQNVTLTV